MAGPVVLRPVRATFCFEHSVSVRLRKYNNNLRGILFLHPVSPRFLCLDLRLASFCRLLYRSARTRTSCERE